MIPMEQNRNTEIAGQPKSGAARVIALIVFIAIVAFFTRSYWMGGGKAPQAQQGMPERQAPPVVVFAAQKTDLAVGSEYIGRVEPVRTVLLKPQVAGEIRQVHFKEGAIVKAGQPLFSLDSKQFAATVELKKAELAKAEAVHSRAQKYYARLKAADSRSISASDIDIAENDVLQGKAAIEQARASLRLAQIDLGHTRITAPISGQIGRAAFTEGNYVTPSSGVLASIVQMNPIRVVFALPDKDYLDQMKAFKASAGSVYNTTIRLANGESYPFGGERDFEDNAIDEKTGTIMMRLRFDNNEGLLVPGAMVRVMTKPVRSHMAVVMPQEAILADAQGDYVYIVDATNKAHKRGVKLGAEIGVMREVLSGLEEGENVIVRGLQSVYPEIEVKPAPLKAAGEEKSAAERAMESVHDIQAPPEDASADNPESAEGKN